MLPQLLNIIGGTKVRGSPCNSRANGHAISPDTTTIENETSASTPFAARSKSFDDKATKISIGQNTSMFALFAPAMLGLAMRP